MEKIEIIDADDDRYSEIPSWDGKIESWTDYAVLIGKNWFPISQMRKDEDDVIYFSNWILDKKGM
jgi:hypothetical protein